MKGTSVTVHRTPSIQDLLLKHLCDSGVELMMFLVNGIRLLGRIKRFDNFTVELVRDGKSQIIYKHSISAINPAEPVELPDPTSSG
jgi:host factor-I protein